MMDQNGLEEELSRVTFQEMIVKAYERGTSETELTVGKLLEELILDLKNIIAK